jgi:hypothetical protein
MQFEEFSEEAHQNLRGIAEGVRGGLADATGPEKAVLEDVLSFVEDAARRTELCQARPGESFETGLALLSEAEQRLFMLRNVLEAMKRGEDPRTTLRRYKDLGLLKCQEVPQTPDPEVDAEVAKFQGATAHAAMWGTKQIRRVAAVATSLVVEAARAIPKLGKLKMGVTFVAGIPCPSFQTEFSTEEWDFGELWEKMSSAYKNAKV